MGVVGSVRGANSDSGSDGVVAVDSGNTSAHRLGSWPDAAPDLLYAVRCCRTDACVLRVDPHILGAASLNVHCRGARKHAPRA